VNFASYLVANLYPGVFTNFGRFILAFIEMALIFLKVLIVVCVYILQPVTQGEMDKAARISPLALCLVKPPAPELLHSMPVRDQRQLLADWAEATNLAATLTPLSTGAKKTPKPAPRDEGTSLRYLCPHHRMCRGIKRCCDLSVRPSTPMNLGLKLCVLDIWLLYNTNSLVA